LETGIRNEKNEADPGRRNQTYNPVFKSHFYAVFSTSQQFANLSFSHEKMSIFSFGLSRQTAAADGAREIRESGICFVRSLDPAESNSQATD
jgi:hypothetical protein